MSSLLKRTGLAMSFRMMDLKTAPPVQSWAAVAGWGCALCVLPSALWRVAMLSGINTGFAETEIFRGSIAAAAYVIGLEVLQVTGGILCLGLIQRWGEVWPFWVPKFAGRTITPELPFCLGLAANIALYVLIFGVASMFAGQWLGIRAAWVPTVGMSAAQVLWLTVCYAPMLAWPPLLSIALLGFWRRRRPFLSRQTR